MPFWTATGHLSECARRDLETYRDFWPALLLMESRLGTLKDQYFHMRVVRVLHHGKNGERYAGDFKLPVIDLLEERPA